MYQKGLNNLGNTCYLNATIQCLYHLKPFSNYMLKKYIYFDKGITGKFVKVMEYLNNSSYKSYCLEEFVSSFYAGNEMFKKYEQNDCHIFLVSLLNAMNKEMIAYNQDDIISKLFCNYIENKTFSPYGISQAADKEPSYCISLPIKNKKGKVYTTLEECIKNFQSNKTITDSYTGKTYKEETKIYPSGKFLIFNLQRLFEGRHITNFIKYPDVLTFGNFNYELVGLIKHIGTEYSGHKVALCKEANTWFEFNDNLVYTLSGRLPEESLVFLLFYEKKNDSFSNFIISDIPESKSYPNNFSKNINSILDKYKIYEKEEKEKEKKIRVFIETIYKYNNNKIKNEYDFFQLYPGRIMPKNEFISIFKIADIPDYFIENYDINYFKLIDTYKRILGK